MQEYFTLENAISLGLIVVWNAYLIWKMRQENKNNK